MLDVISTTLDIEHVLSPLDKDATGHKSLLDKLAGGTVLAVGGLATLGAIPIFYLITAYRKTNYWNHISSRITELDALQNSQTIKESQKTKIVAEKRLIQLHLLKDIKNSLGTNTYDELKAKIAEKRFDVNTVETDTGYSLFHYAVQYEFQEKEDHFKNPESFRSNLEEVIKLIDDLATKPSSLLNLKAKNGMTPFLLAAEYNLDQTFLALLKNPDLDVNARNINGLTPFQQIIQTPTTATPEMVKALLKHPRFDLKENLDMPSKYPALISAACRFKQRELISMLLDMPGTEFLNQPNPNGAPVIHDLISYFEHNNDYSDLSKLANRVGIDYKTAENNGSLLHYVLINNNLRFAKALLKDPKVDVNEVNTWGRTPLDLVPEGSEIQKLLLDRGALKSKI